MASVWISPSLYCCTSKRRRVRRDGGKAVGSEALGIVLLEVSAYRSGCTLSLHILVSRAADFASQSSFTAGVGFREVVAVGAEDERSNGSHVSGMRLITCKFLGCECVGL